MKLTTIRGISCADCSQHIPVGESVVLGEFGWVHPLCEELRSYELMTVQFCDAHDCELPHRLVDGVQRCVCCLRVQA